MLYLRPQRVYKPSALSYLGDPSDIVDSIIDRYLNKDLYRLRIETHRGTSITADNSQITCYAHIFDKGDGTELTDLLKGRGFHPTWLLDGKPIDSARISEEGYQLTLETDHLPAIYQAVTLQARDTDILLALTTDEIQKRIYSQLIELGSIPTNLLKTSEKLLNISRLDKIRVEGLEEIKQDLAKALASKLATSQQQAVDEAVKRAEELDKKLKVGGRNLIRAGYFEKVYFRSDTDKFISYDDKDKKITYIGKASRWNSWVWLSDMEDVTTINLRKAIGEYTLSFSVRGRGTVSFEVVGNYKTNYSDYKTTVQTLTEDWQRVSCPFTRSAEDSSLFCLYNDKPETGDWVQFADDWKLERGTVATDWTPAPEDLDDSISKVNKSLTSLASTLLDPDQGEIHKLTSQLATSQQQAVDEAVRQAGEMDKQIKVGGRNLIRNGSEAKRQCGEWVTYRLYKPIEQSEPLTLSFDVIKVEKPPIGGRFLVFFFYYSNFRTATSVKYEEGKKRYSVSVQALNYNYDLYGDKKDYDPDAVFIYPNSSYDSGGGCFTVSNVKLERGTIATDWTPAPEDVAESVSKVSKSLEELSDNPLTVDENGFWKIWSVKDGAYKTTQYQSRGEAGHSTSPEDVLGNEHFRQLLDSSVTTAVGPRLSQSDLEIDNAFKYIQAISNKLDSTYKIDITTSGYVTARCEQACSYVAKGTAPEHMPTCHIPGSRPQIRIALRSDFDTLKRQVDSLSARINQLEDSANITPVLDTTLRRRPSLIDKSKVTLYPLYGDWILTSDVDDQYISFSGLSAEVGKSIYIQTRRKAYLYANNHSFYGLPGTSSSIAVNQWLAKNTTYRFVRASSDSWLVTASSSPYPWT